MSNTAVTHPSFKHLRSKAIDSLNITISEFEHIKTGAKHFHMAADNPENVFLVGLRTVPMDSTGVAHILEHTALCGSEKYPVRDPFFMMIRRSLNTFMNAFTSSDWTAYPFASKNRKDFNNLLDVYLDAVFFSRLDPLDFAQEGHRVEFEEPKNPNSDLVYKGVVFNEMKGAMSSVSSTLWQTICKYLYPNNTYHYNSGGEPRDIPDLSYQQLKDFYQQHYHPSNAFFMTYGDMPVEELQSQFEEKALHRFEKLDINIQVPFEKRYLAPMRVEESYAYDDPDDSSNKNHVVMGWLIGDSTNLEDNFKAHLLNSVLLDNSSSPLLKALETSDLGASPSPMCGLEDSMRELTFVCGLAGCEQGKTAEIEALIIDTLTEVAENGVPYEQVAAVLHQLELQQREIGGDGYPFGLQIILSAMGSVTHRGDPVEVLNVDPVLKNLHEAIQDPEYIKQLAKELLLENTHRVTLTLSPDKNLSTRQEVAEKQQLAAIKAQLSETEKTAIVNNTQALLDRQNQQDDESILPKVGLEDVPEDILKIDPQIDTIGTIPLYRYAQGTNGLVYQQIVIELPQLNEEELKLLPFLSHFMTELGVGANDYLSVQTEQASILGSITAYSTMRGKIDNEQDLSAYFILSSKALAKNQEQQSQFMFNTLLQCRFDELRRINELVSQMRTRREQSVTGNGHSLAMAAASSGMSAYAQLNHQLSGLAGIQYIKDLDKQLQNEDKLQEFSNKLIALHQKILLGRKQLLLVAEADKLDECQKSLAALWQNKEQTEKSEFALTKLREPVKQLWIANTQVNFCAKAYPTVPVEHPDAPALTVLGGFLRNGFLHRAIREQGGAYGGGATHDSNIATFKFYSYRDPRVSGTLNDFDASIEWLLNTEHSADSLEQAILGVISSIDKPGSPAGEAKKSFNNDLFGRSYQQRKAFRSEVLKVSLDDLKRVTQSYLVAEKASIAIVSNQNACDELETIKNQFNLTEFTI